MSNSNFLVNTPNGASKAFTASLGGKPSERDIWGQVASWPQKGWKDQEGGSEDKSMPLSW